MPAYLSEPATSYGAPFKEYLKQVVVDLEPILAERLKMLEAEMVEISPIVSDLAHAFTVANAGGKRVRSALVEFGYEMLTGERSVAIRQAAAAYEIMQTAILSHDDVVDRSELRRGVPTLYQSIGNNHRGFSHGITLADVGYFYSFRMLSELDIPEKALLRGIRWFAKAMQHTGIGQVFDVELPYVTDRTEQDALTAYAWKTGWYTVTAPICMGATYAGASEELVEQLIPATQAAGIAFQIHDDILGVFGSADLTKKSVNSDIVEGKHTVLSAFVLREAPEAAVTRFTALYGNQDITPDQVEEVRQIIFESGALAHAQQLAQEYVQECERQLVHIQISDESKATIRSMAYFFIERSA